MPAASAPTESSDIDETRIDLEKLYKEYNDLCDRCDAVDARHLAAVAAHSAVIAEHDVFTVALQRVHTDTEQAREVLLNVQRQVTEKEYQCSQLRNDECTYMQRMAECDEHDARRLELQDQVRGLEDIIVALEDAKKGLQRHPVLPGLHRVHQAPPGM